MPNIEPGSPLKTKTTWNEIPTPYFHDFVPRPAVDGSAAENPYFPSLAEMRARGMLRDSREKEKGKKSGDGVDSTARSRWNEFRLLGAESPPPAPTTVRSAPTGKYPTTSEWEEAVNELPLLTRQSAPATLSQPPSESGDASNSQDAQNSCIVTGQHRRPRYIPIPPQALAAAVPLEGDSSWNDNPLAAQSYAAAMASKMVFEMRSGAARWHYRELVSPRSGLKPVTLNSDFEDASIGKVALRSKSDLEREKESAREKAVMQRQIDLLVSMIWDREEEARWWRHQGVEAQRRVVEGERELEKERAVIVRSREKDVAVMKELEGVFLTVLVVVVVTLVSLVGLASSVVFR